MFTSGDFLLGDGEAMVWLGTRRTQNMKTSTFYGAVKKQGGCGFIYPAQKKIITKNRWGKTPVTFE